jgi:hypothetical protein
VQAKYLAPSLPIYLLVRHTGDRQHVREHSG